MAESIETPFRICDEFDVYMDAVARTTALHLIVAAAEKAKSRQVICITCKDIRYERRHCMLITAIKHMRSCTGSDLESCHEKCYTTRHCKIQSMTAV